MRNLWFSSDHHFFHKNILKLQRHTRRGETIEEHHELLIEAHNSVVKPNDTVWFLGDLSFGKSEQTVDILERLNGVKNIVFGNHDHWLTPVTRSYFASGVNYHVLKDSEMAVLFHYPIAEWDRMHYGSYHVHGHAHGAYKAEGRILDVGIDNRPNKDMLPWNWDEIVQYMEARPFKERSHKERKDGNV